VPTETTKPVEAYKVMLLLASTVLLIGGLHAARNFFIPVSLAFFLAAVSFPITNWLREHRVPRFFAVLMTVFVVFAFGAAFIIGTTMLINQLSEGARLEEYGRKLYDVALSTGAQLEEWHVTGAQEEIKKLISENSISGTEKNLIIGNVSFYTNLSSLFHFIDVKNLRKSISDKKLSGWPGGRN